MTEAQLERDADRAVAKRAATGPFLYLFALMLFDAECGAWRASPRVAGGLTAAMALICLVRQVFLDPDRWEPRIGIVAWRRIFAVTAVAMPAVFGTYLAAMIQIMGFGGSMTILLIIDTALVMGGVHALAPRPRLARMFPILLLGLPIVSTAFVTGAWRTRMLPLYAAYALYALHLARRLHAEYWQAARANQSLAAEMKSRLQAEAELRQAHKLEAVGRLASGVAHEINTPVQFVSDSLQFLRDAARDLFALIDRRATEDEIDLAYLRENVDPAFDRSLDGLDRVATIVRSMKEFAHPDATDMQQIDLNRAIESTLAIARNEYKYVADVETDFGALPPVTCYAGDFNQAVLNIVVNAAHAIADVVAGTGGRGRITVTTRHEGPRVVIAIADTGGGIPDAIRDRIFDPFFTTKPVGRGTGQGLAIARSVVVDRHHGELSLTTGPGGTTFLIRLPVDPPAAAALASAA